MLTILVNIRINSPERLQHLKDGVLSFNTVSDNWLINVRGLLREEAIDFLKKQLGKKITLFKLLDDKRTWLKNASDMLKKAKYEYVLIWNEDHLNLAPQKLYLKIVEEMKEEKCDYLFCSWWHFGKYRQAFEKQHIKRGQYIDSIILNKENWKQMIKDGHDYYLISLMGIFKKSFLRSLIKNDTSRLPLQFTFTIFKLANIISQLGIKVEQQKFFRLMNKLFFYKLRKYSDETPFELEKDQSRIDLLPIKYTIPKQELFACIDEDLGVEGYQLIKRGIYPTKNYIGKNEEKIEKSINRIVEEVNFVLKKIDDSQVQNLIEAILSANKIIVCGAGRVGMAARAFGMRLAHLGFSAYTLGDSSVPRLGKGDLLLAASGSGETQTIFDLVAIAKKNESRIALVTGNLDSRMGKLADVILHLQAPSKNKSLGNFNSAQPMTTLNEQCLWILFDALVLQLMKRTNQTNEDMWNRHVNLE